MALSLMCLIGPSSLFPNIRSATATVSCRVSEAPLLQCSIISLSGLPPVLCFGFFVIMSLDIHNARQDRTHLATSSTVGHGFLHARPRQINIELENIDSLKDGLPHYTSTRSAIVPLYVCTWRIPPSVCLSLRPAWAGQAPPFPVSVNL